MTETGLSCSILFNFRLVLKLIKPLILEQGQRFTLRDGVLTLGTGVVTKVMPALSERERLLLVEGKKARQAAATQK
jgi:elongation factor Tu